MDNVIVLTTWTHFAPDETNLTCVSEPLPEEKSQYNSVTSIDDIPFTDLDIQADTCPVVQIVGTNAVTRTTVWGYDAAEINKQQSQDSNIKRPPDWLHNHTQP